jgi:copper transporter 1
MLFTWNTENLCIIFREWHVRSTFSLKASLAAVALLTAGYEFVREASRRYEVSSAEYMNSLPSEYAPALVGCPRAKVLLSR